MNGETNAAPGTSGAGDPLQGIYGKRVARLNAGNRPGNQIAGNRRIYGARESPIPAVRSQQSRRI